MKNKETSLVFIHLLVTRHLKHFLTIHYKAVVLDVTNHHWCYKKLESKDMDINKLLVSIDFKKWEK